MIRLLFAAAAFAMCLSAQTLKGRVKDAQGNAVPEAEIRLYRQDNGTAWRTASNLTGEFVFERLTSGSFLLEAEKENFRGAILNVQIDGGASKNVDISLDLAGVSQSVVVTATGTPQTLDEISKAFTLVSGEEIQNRNEYAISEILRTVPGLLITNGGGPGQNTSIRIRGLRPDAAAVLVDGLRFRDASTTQSDASSFLSTLNFVDADRVEVLRGSGSSLYGTNAISGVVNVVTQEGGAPLHGQLQAEGGNLGLYRGRGSIGGGAFHNRLKYTAGFLHLNVMCGVDGHDANRNTGGQGFLRYDFTPRMSASARLWGADDFVQLNMSPTTTGVPAANFPATGTVPAIPLSPAGVAILNAGGQPSFGNATYISGRDDTDYRKASRFLTSAFIFRHTLTPRVSWQTSYQRVHTNRIYQNGPGGTGSQPAALNYSNQVGDIDTADVRGTAQLTPWMSLIGGYEFEREYFSDYQNNNLPAPRLIVARTRINQNSHAGYFATQLGLLGRRLQISLSGRAQAFRLSPPEFQLIGTANNYDRIPLTAPGKALTGDFAIAYLIGRSNTKLRAHVGNAYRAPSLYERFGAGFSANPVNGQVVFTPYGDPRLNPDRYNSVDGGIDQYLFNSRVRVSATYFYSRVVSITAFDFSGGLNPATDPYGRSSGYINGSGGMSRGFELGVEARPMRTLTMSGSYTYTNANMDRDITVAGFYRVLGVPRHTTTLVATRSWTKRLDTTVDLFHGSNYYTSFFAVTQSRAFKFPEFTKVDLMANYRLWENERRSARVYGKVDNLFNQRYYQGGWLAPRATFVLGIGYGF